MYTRRSLLQLGGSAWLTATGHAQPRTLVIAAGEIPPYASARKDDSFLEALFGEIGPLMGVQFQFRYLPWRRCEAAIEDLDAWGAVPYVATAEREKKFVFSAPLYAKQTRLFYYSPPGRAPIADAPLAELARFRIGGVRGYFYDRLLREAGIVMDEALSEEQNFRKLHAGRIDLAASVDAVGWAVIHRQFPASEAQHFHTLETPLHVGFNHLMSSIRYPQTQALIEQFNAALTTLRRNGVYKRVAESFGLTAF